MSEEDTDDEIFSRKRKKTNRIGSDESDMDSSETKELVIGPSQDTVAGKSLVYDEHLDKSCKTSHLEEENISPNHPSTSSLASKPVTEGQIQDFKQLFSDKDLYDPEDSDDDKLFTNDNSSLLEKSDQYDAEGSSDEGYKETKLTKKSKPPKAKKSIKNNEEKKEIEKIHSETQRIVRQSRVSLPYHTPRQRTLAEFLQRRPSIPTKSIKMSIDELNLMAKHVARRAREAEEFFKSSSDEEPKQDSSDKKTDVANLLPESEERNDLQLEKDVSEIEDINKEVPSKKVLCPDKVGGLEETLSVKSENHDILDFSQSCNKSQISGDESKINDKICDNRLEFQRCLDLIDNIPGKHSLVNTEDTENSFNNNNPPSVGVIAAVHFSDELNSQDLNLRIEDTVTCDGVSDKDMEERSRSNAIEITKYSETRGNNFEIEKGEITDITHLNDVDRDDTQNLHLRIEYSGPLNATQDLMEKELSSENLFGEGGSTKDNENSAICNRKMMRSDSFPYNEQMASQDLCLRIGNTETTDSGASNQNEESKNELKDSELRSTSNDVDMLSIHSRNLYFLNENTKKNLMSENSESQNSGLHLNERDTSVILTNRDNNETTQNGEINLKKSSQGNCLSLVSDSESQLEGNISCEDNKNSSSGLRKDDLKLILEGEETRIAFEPDNSLNGRLIYDGADDDNESEKHKTKQNSSIQNCEEVMFTTEMSKSENAVDKSNILEKQKEYSKQSYDFLLRVKDSSFDSKEDALRAIKKLRSNDDANSVKLLRTMSLLEDRLQSSRKSIKLQKEVPRLKGSPSKVIDFDETPSSCDISTLKQRFLRHSSCKITALQKTTGGVSATVAEVGATGEVQEEKEIVTVESETENLLGSRTKLIKLKEELQKHIVKEREQEWNKRQLESKEESSHIGGKSDWNISDEDDVLKDIEVGSADENDDEAEDSESEDEESDEEDEYEREEKIKNEKGKSKNKPRVCDFVDDEAEVSDTGDESDDSDYENGTRLSEQSEESILPGLTKVDIESPLSIPPYQLGGAVSQISDPVEEPYVKIVPPTLPPLAEDRSSENVFSSSFKFAQPSATYGELDIENSLNEADADEAELLSLCSGKFTSLSPNISEDVPSSDLGSLFPSGKKIGSLQSSQNTPVATASLQDCNFTDNTSSDSLQKTKLEKTNMSNNQLVSQKKLIITSEDEDEEFNDKVKKKMHLKLQFSDDEDENEEKSDKDSVFSDQNESQGVEYDSEENEIIVKSSNARDFFENEAELSESEWGSADEDEKDLDDFEEEAGDEEHLDQSKVKEQLGKIHMRRVLDDDQQEVRRLQELLLEDGEFHSESGGRQRQFRWKSLNNDDFQFTRESDEIPRDDDEEEENESEWRRMRFERETFLQEHKNSLEKEDNRSDPVNLNFETPVLLPRKSGQVKRGSFLTRSEAALARIAQFTKNSTEINVLAPTNSRNFVFSSLSQDPKEDVKPGKRKPIEAETPTAKKMCINVSLLDQLG